MNTQCIVKLPLLVLLACSVIFAGQGEGTDFVNWESPHVHPLDRTPNGKLLLAVNTPDNRLEIFSLPDLKLKKAIPVGLDPVSVRLRNNHEAWVVNHISDSISIVDLKRKQVVRTLQTDDEPADVVFAGQPERAFVTCSQANTILVFDPNNPDAEPRRIDVVGEDPRALSVSPDGSRVYAAVFESGNSTTLVSGGFVGLFGEPPFPQGATDPENPYAGVSPAPNNGTEFNPPMNPNLPPPPPVGVIVKKDEAGAWRDDNGTDWSAYISGDKAERSARVPGWDLNDHDLVVIDANNLQVRYVDRLMNINMALSVNPRSGKVMLVGTEALNQVRFEPVLNGVFVRVQMAMVDPDNGAKTLLDMNPHLDYQQTQVPMAERREALGDPRGVTWDRRGKRAYVAGMGSNNVVVFDERGARDGARDVIPVGEGPTGLVFGKDNKTLYVLNKFDASISMVDTVSRIEVRRVPFFDPSPAAIKNGRKHLYNTTLNSGLGQASCGSCHVDARTDGLAWDLGDPAGEIVPIQHQNLGFGHPVLSAFFEEHHPMKGPMTTQTLQDIIGKEPLHWRGDKDALADFNGAFVNLQGSDRQLSSTEMAQFSEFLSTIHFPPNPYRNLDNSLSTDLSLEGQVTTSLLGEAGIQLPNGNAQRGLELFQPPNRLAVFELSCMNCHTLPTGLGTNAVFDGERYQTFEGTNPTVAHHGLVSGDGQSNVTIKVPHFRNLYEKVGMEVSNNTSTRGFGFSHDGAVWSLAQIISSQLFLFESIQDQADVIAFLMSFAGSDLPSADGEGLDAPPGTQSKDSHAGVGRQLTLTSTNLTQEESRLLALMLSQAEAQRLGLVAKTRNRGFAYLGGGLFQADSEGVTRDIGRMLRKVTPKKTLTLTLVPKGSERRIGIDRDSDGILDRDERGRGLSEAGNVVYFGQNDEEVSDED